MIQVAIDIGGTFTDCLMQDDDGALRQFKVPSTPQEPSIGLIQALERAAGFTRQSTEEFLAHSDLIIAHGTTLATNALLTGNGAKVGMLTTKGFRDTIEMRRGFKNIGRSRFDIFIPPYKPLVPRRLRRPVEERIRYTGDVQAPLNEDDVRAAVENLQGQGIEALAICFLHSYANPEHEQRAADICRSLLEGVYITTSSDVLPVWREYERFSTTVVSAYIGPIVEQHLTLLEKKLRALGLRGSLNIVQAGGIIQSIDASIRRAVTVVGSGPAAAPSAAIFFGKSYGKLDLLSLDMGGTSLDISLIRDGVIPATDEKWVGEERIAMKMVDAHSVGAGGGSIAWIDALGLLRVGPQSAGADPGPACYGLGGEAPTVTDADLVLGFLPADYFLGGEMVLDVQRARDAVQAVAEPLNLDHTAAAHAIFRTVNSFMADRITEVSTKRGMDLRDFTLVAGGGAGPVHAGALAELLEIEQIIVPPFAGVLSAFGILNMDIGHHDVRSYFSPARLVDAAHVNALFGEMEEEARALFSEMRLPLQKIEFRRSADLRYMGQFHEVEVEGLPLEALTSDDLSAAVETFHQLHETLYTFNMPFRDVEFLNFRLKALIRRLLPPLQEIEVGGADPSPAQKRTRACCFDPAEGYVEAPVYAGDLLQGGNVIEGPAIIEEAVTTIVVPRTFRCAVNPTKTYHLTRRPADHA